MYAITDPSTGKTTQTFPTATDADMTAAVDAAHAATAWGRSSSVAERAALLRRLGELHVQHRAELATNIVKEMGKPLEEAEGEIDFCVDIYHYYADHAEEFLADEELTVTSGPGRAVVRRAPVGVLLGIMPWNFPAYQVARFAAPNLALGNTIVLKHAPQCPATAALLERLCAEAGFPVGAYVNVYATNEQIAQVIADPRVQGVSLTGSERVAPPSPRSPDGTSRRPYSNSAAPTRSSCCPPTTSTPSWRRPSPPVSTTPARPATPPSGSSSSPISTTRSRRSSPLGSSPANPALRCPRSRRPTPSHVRWTPP